MAEEADRTWTDIAAERAAIDDVAADSDENASAAADVFKELISQVTWLRGTIVERERLMRGKLMGIEPANLTSARNLIHYLALRLYDIRDLQNHLARNGISSLGRSESHVLSNLDKVLSLLHRIVNETYEPPHEAEIPVDLDEGKENLVRRTDALLGPPPSNRKVRIMVTFSTQAAEDYELVRELIASGMDCARINCAHDTPEVWARMIENIRRAREEAGRYCRICIDIPGPRLRTGPFEPGPQVIKWRPKRDVLGRVASTARIWLTSNDQPLTAPVEATAHITLPAEFVKQLMTGDKIDFTDARGSSRSLRVKTVLDDGIWLETPKTAYVVPETEFRVKRDGGRSISARPGPLPPTEQFALLHTGDTLVFIRPPEFGRPARIGPTGDVLEPARIPCTLPDIFNVVRPGQKIWFDDGKIGGVISSVDRKEIRVEITHAAPKGQRLKADKGINLPDTDLGLPALTDEDRKLLPFIAQHADLVGYSFVRSANDIETLQKELRKNGGGDLGIILKIETRSAFKNFPELLLAAMRTSSAGVMIARGDLAVEAGFERLAEVQEEILWMCEAAHMPVIWATQVLEQLSKKGVFSRAEITDAAMSERAECVMLNKGQYVLHAVRTLDDVLHRMQSHQEKKRAMMRPLRLAKDFFNKRR